MESNEIKAMLGRYWRAETTLEEEEWLAAYFRQPAIDPELESVRELFAWRDEEAQIRPAADFDRRILDRIAAMDAVVEKAPVLRRGWFQGAAAAAVILGVGISLLISVTAPDARPREVLTGGPPAVRPPVSSTIKDTYADPKEALAAVQHALLLASARMNEGEHITQKSMTRLHTSWEAATGD